MGYHEDRYIDYLAEQAGQLGGDAWADNYDPASSLQKGLSSRRRTMLVTFNISVVIEEVSVEEAQARIKGLADYLKIESPFINDIIIEPLKPVINEEVKCPDCGGKMKSRSGKYGTFWGCLDYPKCTGTRDSEGRSKADREKERETKKSNQQQEHYRFNKT